MSIKYRKHFSLEKPLPNHVPLLQLPRTGPAALLKAQTSPMIDLSLTLARKRKHRPSPENTNPPKRLQGPQEQLSLPLSTWQANTCREEHNDCVGPVPRERMDPLLRESADKFPALKRRRTEAVHRTADASAVTLLLHQE